MIVEQIIKTVKFVLFAIQKPHTRKGGIHDMSGRS